MDVLLLLGLLGIGLLAGVMGTVFGVGGGIIIVPAMTVIIGLSAQEAAAVSLMGIAASSSYAASYFIAEEMVNVRLGMIILVPTVLGSIVGASLALELPEWIILALLAAVMAYSGIYMLRKPERLSAPPKGEKSQMVYRNRCEVGGPYREYQANRAGSSLAIGGVNGAIAGLTGIGGGSINVPLMNIWMGVPMKVSTSTSSFIISITSMSGALVYYLNGTLLPLVAGAVCLGMLGGSMLGARLARRIDGRSLRSQFAVFMFIMGAVSLLKAGGIL